jgi:hypothetical protein
MWLTDQPRKQTTNIASFLWQELRATKVKKGEKGAAVLGCYVVTPTPGVHIILCGPAHIFLALPALPQQPLSDQPPRL